MRQCKDLIEHLHNMQHILSLAVKRVNMATANNSTALPDE